MAIEGIDVPRLLADLDRRGPHDRAARSAARVIRDLEIQLSSVEGELLDSELRVFAHAVEVDRMKDHRRSWEERRSLKMAKQ